MVQIMAWRRPDDKPLAEPMMDGLMAHICVIRPQWIKIILYGLSSSWFKWSKINAPYSTAYSTTSNILFLHAFFPAYAKMNDCRCPGNQIAMASICVQTSPWWRGGEWNSVTTWSSGYYHVHEVLSPLRPSFKIIKAMVTYLSLQYIPRNMHTVFAWLCFVVVIHWLIFPYPPGLLCWHCGNLTIAPVPAKQPWWIWINISCEFIMNDCITTTKQKTTKPCAYFLGYTVYSYFIDDRLSYVTMVTRGGMEFSNNMVIRVLPCTWGIVTFTS